MTKRKILFITYDGLTDNLGQSQVLPYLTGLSKCGHQVFILSTEKKDNFKRNAPTIEELLKEHRIRWNFIWYSKHPPVISTLFDLWSLKRKAEILQKRENFQIVHCRSYLPSLIGLYLKRKYEPKFIFDMRGFWADERVEGNLWNLKNPFYKKIYQFFKKKEKDFVRNADAIISLTNVGKNEILSWPEFEKLNNKIHVIPCCVDTYLFDPKEHHNADLKESFGIEEDDLVICYLGSLGTYYLLDEMLVFFTQLKKQVTNSKLLFISPKSSHNAIREACSAKSIPETHVIVTESPRSQVAKHLTLADYSVFFYKKGYSKLGMSPTKQAELMAMGIPVICNKGIGDTQQIIERYHSGILIDDFSEETLHKAAKKIIDSKFDKTNIRNGAIEYYSLELGVKRYNDVYLNLLSD